MSVAKKRRKYIKQGFEKANKKMGIENLEEFTIFPKEIVNGKTIISNAKCDNDSTGGYMWIADQVRFDEPTDVTVTFTCKGAFGVGPIGVTYAK